MAVFGEAPAQLPLYTRKSGGVPFEIDGVFDDAYHALVLAADGDPSIATIEPVIGVRLAQFGDQPPVQGDRLTIPRVGKAFVVANVQPDGHGWAKLLLNLV